MSAHKVRVEEHEAAASMRALAAEYETLGHLADALHWVAVLGASGLTTEEVRAVEDSPAFGALTTALRRAEACGLPVERAVRGRIVGYLIDSRMKSRIAVAALDNAVARRGDEAGCVVHSDRGSQFRSRKLVRALHRRHMVRSMGQVGAAGDNAAMESSFSPLRKNVLDRRAWTTREDLRIAIVTWIERTYQRRRRQAALSRLTPIEYELTMTLRQQPAPENHCCHQFVLAPFQRGCSVREPRVYGVDDSLSRLTVERREGFERVKDGQRASAGGDQGVNVLREASERYVTREVLGPGGEFASTLHQFVRVPTP